MIEIHSVDISCDLIHMGTVCFDGTPKSMTTVNIVYMHFSLFINAVCIFNSQLSLTFLVIST